MSETFDPNALAWFSDEDDVPPGFQYVDETMILNHIADTKELPEESAAPFVAWANEAWNDFEDGSDTQTNGQVIAGMLAYWRGQ